MSKEEPQGAVIVIDTREQQPYRFLCESVRSALKTGDYSLIGLETIIAIERKSLNDFIGCITASRERFENELNRADSLERFWVVIESTLTSIEKGLYRSKVNPESVLGTLAAWSNRHKVSFVFADSRQAGQKMTERLLKHAWLEHLKRLVADRQAAMPEQDNRPQAEWGQV